MVESFQFSCNKLNVTYETDDGACQALIDVSFNLSHEELLFICGPNGSGKTTLLRALAGTVKYEGQLRFLYNDTSWKDWEEQRDSNFLWIPQNVDEVLAYSMSIEELSTLCNFEEVMRLAKKENVEWLLNNGKQRIGKRLVKELSGGQKQLLVGLIALSERKPLLLLDEVFRPFDNKTRDAYLQMLRDYIKLSKGSAIIVSHDLVFAKENATRLIVLQNGKVSLDSKADNVGLKELIEFFK